MAGRLWTTFRLGCAAVVLALAIMVAPTAYQAGRWLAAGDDHVKLADLQVEQLISSARVAEEIEAALAAGDPELAASFAELADAHRIAVAPDLREKIKAAQGAQDSASYKAASFVRGFVVGDPDDLVSLAGTAAGDLFVYGDIRDLVREGASLVRGEKADELVLGIAAVGLAVTAGTYASLGAASPGRVGLSVVKAGAKTGRVTAKLAAAVARELRAVVDTAALRRGLSAVPWHRPGAAADAAKQAVRLERGQGLMTLAQDVGRVQAKLGARGTLDALKLADEPKDVAKLAALAQAKGGKTRAVLKLLGRGAITATTALFALTSWVFWLLTNLLWLVVAIKAATERATLRVIRFGKRARARRLAKAQAAAAGVSARNDAAAEPLSALPVAMGAPGLVPDGAPVMPRAAQLVVAPVDLGPLPAMPRAAPLPDWSLPAELKPGAAKLPRATQLDAPPLVPDAPETALGSAGAMQPSHAAPELAA